MKIRSLTSLGLTVTVAAIVAVVLAAGGSAKQVAGASAVNVRHTSVGQTLVDANGRTLYLFEGDRDNVSTLSAAGRAVWPPFKPSGAVKAEGGVLSGKLGTTASGVKQVTYNGHPLYYYVGDHGPGTVKGQNLKEFGALWFVLAPSGNANTHTAAGASTSQPAPAPASTYNYGY